jgi:hypothetical protein
MRIFSNNNFNIIVWDKRNVSTERNESFRQVENMRPKWVFLREKSPRTSAQIKWWL